MNLLRGLLRKQGSDAGEIPMTLVAGAVGLDDPAAAEAVLMARLAQGDGGAPMSELYDRYGGRLYGLGLRLLGDRGMAEEMVQETFVRLWRSSGSFDSSKGSVPTFLFTIARRTAIDLRRRPSSRPLPSSEHIDNGVTDGEFESLLLGLDVRDALGALTAKHREVLELHFAEDLTQPQVAERLGVAVGTVKTRTYYGLKALRVELEERGLLD